MVQDGVKVCLSGDVWWTYGIFYILGWWFWFGYGDVWFACA
jgi:hypothetical protein